MKTVGDILKKRREEKELSFSDVEKSIKIRKVFLEAIEKGEYNKLPPAAFTRGFFKNYSEFLGLNTKEVLALYRREFDERRDRRLLPSGVSEPLDENIFTITPNRITLIILLFFFGAFFTFLISQYMRLSGAPTMMVYETADNVVVNNKDMQITGKTDPDATVKVNGQVISLKEGSFNQYISLTDGLNTIRIEAIAKNGKSSQIEKHIRLISP